MIIECEEVLLKGFLLVVHPFLYLNATDGFLKRIVIFFIVLRSFAKMDGH